MIFLIYQLILILIIILSPLIIIYRLFKKKEHHKRFFEKFSIISKIRGSGNLVWFHASSVGEVLSIIPLIEKLENNNSISKILITSSTLSSSHIFEKLKLRKTIHQFFPIDNFYFIKKFLKHWKPSLAVFVESEIWPTVFYELEKKTIPLILLNARITKKTFKRWFKIRFFSSNIFNKIKIAYPQNSETIYYLKKLNVKKVKFIGNLKFSESKLDRKIVIQKTFENQFKKRLIWCASSTHANEELECAKTHKKLREKVKNLITIIIPRHIHRKDEILDQINSLKLKVVCHSSNKKIDSSTDIYLVDTYGETKKFYKISNIVFLGGSLIKHGGQNPIEPARLGKSIIHGPYVENFREVYNLLGSKNISFKAKNSKELQKLIRKQVTKSKNDSKKFRQIKIIGNSILDKTVKEINNLLKNEIYKT
tara:strand:- start:5663 stop:6931 length:1269 start_codon:yes stop_codon:yes gene_type:complete